MVIFFKVYYNLTTCKKNLQYSIFPIFYLKSVRNICNLIFKFYYRSELIERKMYEIINYQVVTNSENKVPSIFIIGLFKQQEFYSYIFFFFLELQCFSIARLFCNALGPALYRCQIGIATMGREENSN